MIATILLPLLLPLAIHLQPDAAGTSARQPYIAAAHGQVAVAFGSGNTIYFAGSKDGGQSFSAPVKVAEVEVLALGRHRGPRVTILKDTMLVTAVVGEHLSTAPHAHGLPSDGNLTAWRSSDHGKTWERAGVINDVPGAAREGFHSITADNNGILSVAWLDLRSKGTKLYSSRSTDGGRTWARNVQVYASPYGTICECCNASIIADATGRTTVMWRNVLDGSRDFYTASSSDGVHFTAPQKSGMGTWKINACPMDGGGLARREEELFAAWRREKDVFLSRNGRPEIPIGSGNDVAIVNGGKGIYVAWTNRADLGHAGIVISGPHSMNAAPPAPKLIGPGGAFVSLAALVDGSLIAAWEEDGNIRVERLRE